MIHHRMDCRTIKKHAVAGCSFRADSCLVELEWGEKGEGNDWRIATTVPQEEDGPQGTV
jgi:hypothetical protein